MSSERPSDWPVVRLGDLASIEHGYAFKSDRFCEPASGIPIVVSVGNFQYTGGFRFEETTVKGYAGDYPSRFRLAAGDILLVMTCQTAGGEILGIPGRIPDDGGTYLHNQRLGKVVLKDPELLELDFAYWLILTPEFNRELFRTASGSKILHTAPERIEAFTFALPPLDEQRRIAALLNTLDGKVVSNRRLARKLDQVAGAYHEAVYQNFIGCTKFDEQGAVPIPQGWRLARIDELAEINVRSHTARCHPEEIDYVDISSVSPRSVNAVRHLSYDAAPSRARRIVHAGDTLVSTVRPERRALAFIHDTDPQLTASTGFAVVSPTVGTPTFVYRAVTSDLCIEHLTQCATGSAYPAVNPSILAAWQVPVPPDNGFAYEAFARPLEAQRHHLASESRRLSELIDELLPSVMSGQLDVLDADDFGGRVPLDTTGLAA